MRLAAKRDANEKLIVDALEAAGVHVWRLHSPCDLLCWRLDVGGGRFYALEVKMPHVSRDKRQAAQTEFLRVTGAPIVRSPEQALRAVGAIRG